MSDNILSLEEMGDQVVGSSYFVTENISLKQWISQTVSIFFLSFMSTVTNADERINEY